MRIDLPIELDPKASPDELRLDLALGMFASHRLTLAQAARLAGTNRLGFQRELALRQIPLHYSQTDLEEDLRVVRECDLDDRRQ